MALVVKIMEDNKYSKSYGEANTTLIEVIIPGGKRTGAFHKTERSIAINAVARAQTIYASPRLILIIWKTIHFLS